MSRSIDLFIDSKLALGDLAHALAVLAGAASAQPATGGAYQLRRGDVVAELRTHDYVDDGTLRLSRYPYVLSARFPDGKSPNDAAEVAFIRNAGDLVRQRMDASALVVLDLEQRDTGAGGGGGGGGSWGAGGGSAGSAAGGGAGSAAGTASGQ